MITYGLMLRNKVVKALRNAKANFFINIISNAKGNTKEIWTNINKNDREYQHEYGKFNNTVVQDLRDVAAALKEYFIDSVKLVTQSSGPEVWAPTFHICTVSQVEVEKGHLWAQRSRAKYAFGMDTFFLKTHEQFLISPMTNIIKESITEGECPDCWESAVIILKAADPTVTCNQHTFLHIKNN